MPKIGSACSIFIFNWVLCVYAVNIRLERVAAAEPLWGPFLLALFVAAMLFLLLNAFIVIVLSAYHEAKDAIDEETHSGNVSLINYAYYKLTQWLNRVRKVNYDTMGKEAVQFNLRESELLLLFFSFSIYFFLYLRIRTNPRSPSTCDQCFRPFSH